MVKSVPPSLPSLFTLMESESGSIKAAQCVDVYLELIPAVVSAIGLASELNLPVTTNQDVSPNSTFIHRQTL